MDTVSESSPNLIVLQYFAYPIYIFRLVSNLFHVITIVVSRYTVIHISRCYM